jgi:hypothetical protein
VKISLSVFKKTAVPALYTLNSLESIWLQFDSYWIGWKSTPSLSQSWLQIDAKVWSQWWLQGLESILTPKWLQLGVKLEFFWKIWLKWLKFGSILESILTPILGVIINSKPWSKLGVNSDDSKAWSYEFMINKKCNYFS